MLCIGLQKCMCLHLEKCSVIKGEAFQPFKKVSVHLSHALTQIATTVVQWRIEKLGIGAVSYTHLTLPTKRIV